MLDLRAKKGLFFVFQQAKWYGKDVCNSSSRKQDGNWQRSVEEKKRNFELQPTFWCNVERRFATALQAVECALIHELEKFES